MSGRFTRNRAATMATHRRLAEGHVITAARDAIGQQVVTRARTRANDSQVARSYEVLGERREGDELVLSVGTRHPFGHLDEYGSANNPPSGALRAAVMSLRMRYERH